MGEYTQLLVVVGIVLLAMLYVISRGGSLKNVKYIKQLLSLTFIPLVLTILVRVNAQWHVSPSTMVTEVLSLLLLFSLFYIVLFGLFFGRSLLPRLASGSINIIALSFLFYLYWADFVSSTVFIIFAMVLGVIILIQFTKLVFNKVVRLIEYVLLLATFLWLSYMQLLNGIISLETSSLFTLLVQGYLLLLGVILAFHLVKDIFFGLLHGKYFWDSKLKIYEQKVVAEKEHPILVGGIIVTVSGLLYTYYLIIGGTILQNMNLLHIGILFGLLYYTTMKQFLAFSAKKQVVLLWISTVLLSVSVYLFYVIPDYLHWLSLEGSCESCGLGGLGFFPGGGGCEVYVCTTYEEYLRHQFLFSTVDLAAFMVSPLLLAALITTFVLALYNFVSQEKKKSKFES